MMKSIYKKVFIITLLIGIFFIIISSSNKSFALGDVVKDSIWEIWTPTVEGTEKMEQKAGTILGIVSTIGVIVSVGSLSYIGIKYVVGSVEEKSRYKQTLIPWLFGAIMVFTITTIPTLIYNIATESIKVDGVFTGSVPSTGNNGADNLSGYDDSIQKVYEISNKYKNVSGSGEYVGVNEFKQELKDLKDTFISQHGNEEQYSKGYIAGLDKAITLIEGTSNSNRLPELTEYMAEYRQVVSKVDNGTYKPENIVEETIKLIIENKITSTNGTVLKERLLSQYRAWEEEGKTKETNETQAAYAKGYDKAMAEAEKELANASTSQEFTSNLSEIKQKVRNVINKTYMMNSKVYKGFIEKIDYLSTQSLEVEQYQQYINGHKNAISEIKNKNITSNNIEEAIEEEMGAKDVNTGKEKYYYHDGKLKRLEIQEKIWEEEGK